MTNDDNKRYTIILYGLFLIGSFFFLSLDFYRAFWYDEAYTINLVRQSFGYLWHVTANDVHPPLYYILLKLYTYICGDSVVALRIFSALPMIGIMLLTCTHIRQKFGNKTALSLLVLVILMPVNQYLASEIRMYSFGMFFVLLSALYAYQSYTTFRRSDLIKFTLFSLAAAYTHYYALLGVFYIYLLFFLVVILKKRDKILLFIGYSVLFVIGYLPWLINLPGQVSQVQDEYWINAPQLKDFVIYFYYPFAQELDLTATELPLSHFASAFYMLIVFIVLFIYVVISGRKANFTDKQLSVKRVYASLLFLAFVLTLATAITYSLLSKPVFVTRYMTPILGLLYLGFAIFLASFDWKKTQNKVVLFLMFLILAYFSFNHYLLQYRTNQYNERVQAKIVDFAEERLDDKTAFVYSDTRSFSIAAIPLFFPDSKHYIRIRLTGKYYKKYLENFKSIPIFDFGDIDTTYTKILVVKNIDNDDSFMKVAEDSIEIVKYFDIIDRQDIEGHVVYQLQRKNRN